MFFKHDVILVLKFPCRRKHHIRQPEKGLGRGLKKTLKNKKRFANHQAEAAEASEAASKLPGSLAAPAVEASSAGAVMPFSCEAARRAARSSACASESGITPVSEAIGGSTDCIAACSRRFTPYDSNTIATASAKLIATTRRILNGLGAGGCPFSGCPCCCCSCGAGYGRCGFF